MKDFICFLHSGEKDELAIEMQCVMIGAEAADYRVIVMKDAAVIKI